MNNSSTKPPEDYSQYDDWRDALTEAENWDNPDARMRFQLTVAVAALVDIAESLHALAGAKGGGR